MVFEHPQAQHAVKEFLAAHIRLGRQYREALIHYASEESTSQIIVDMLVRGTDCQPTDLLDKVVRLSHESRNQQLRALVSAINQLENRILITILGTLILDVRVRK